MRWTRSFGYLVPFLLLGCAVAEPPAATPRPALIEWRAAFAEHVALWYHALALTGAGSTNGTLPLYADGYAARVADERRARDLPPTPLEMAGDEFRRHFEADPAFDALNFLPLYFRDTRALLTGLRYWLRVDGDARRAGSTEAADMVARLSTWFPRHEHRRVLARWTEALEQEHQLFFRDYWQAELPRLSAAGEEVQELWSALAPELDTYLRYVRLQRGHLVLVPALGIDGRLVRSGIAFPAAAIGLPDSVGPPGAIWSFVRELMHPVVEEAMSEHMAPARIRELGRQPLASRAAVRGGALLLDRVAPDMAAAYRAYFLSAAGALTEIAGEPDLVAELAVAFPLPPELEAGLEDHVAAALAGI